MATSWRRDADALSLRAGAALAGLDVEDLWRECTQLGGEYIPFHLVLAAVTGPERANRITSNLLGMTINRRLLEQGIAPMFQPQPIIDLD